MHTLLKVYIELGLNTDIKIFIYFYLDEMIENAKKFWQKHQQNRTNQQLVISLFDP